LIWGLSLILNDSRLSRGPEASAKVRRALRLRRCFDLLLLVIVVILRVGWSPRMMAAYPLVRIMDLNWLELLLVRLWQIERLVLLLGLAHSVLIRRGNNERYGLWSLYSSSDVLVREEIMLLLRLVYLTATFALVNSVRIRLSTVGVVDILMLGLPYSWLASSG
jgi:hypothetical protein